MSESKAPGIVESKDFGDFERQKEAIEARTARAEGSKRARISTPLIIYFRYDSYTNLIYIQLNSLLLPRNNSKHLTLSFKMQ
jgi:hypothetical protein